MKKDEDKRTVKDRRDSNDERSEKFIKYFIPEDKEQREGKDRRKPKSDTE